MMNPKINDILDCWFGSPQEPSYGQSRDVWFQKNDDFDQEIRQRFLQDYEQAAAGQLNEWKDSPLSCLALIVLLDQFPRNLFRGTPQAFATDGDALKTAEWAISQGFDQKLLPVQRWFIYLPFEHSESLIHQERSLNLFNQLADDPESQSPIQYAIRHHEVIARFGRFPHRNAILNRPSTPEEEEFLKQPGSSF